MPTMAECHQRVLDDLRARGESEIYNPTGRRAMMNGKWCRPLVYVKGRSFPSRDFICGDAVYEKDGTITIWYDFFAYVYEGFKLEELGLCDPVVWYENIDRVHKIERPGAKVCPTCGRPL